MLMIACESFQQHQTNTIQNASIRNNYSSECYTGIDVVDIWDTSEFSYSLRLLDIKQSQRGSAYVSKKHFLLGKAMLLSFIARHSTLIMPVCVIVGFVFPNLSNAVLGCVDNYRKWIIVAAK